MRIKNLFEEDRAVSPVIGVVLMVAITVILAATIGTFVLGLGDQVQSQAPQTSFSFDHTQDTSDPGDELDVTHDAGDSIDATRVEIVVSGAGDHVDDDGADLQSANDWQSLDPASTDEITAGSTVTLTKANFTADGAGNGTVDALDLTDSTTRITWVDESGDRSATLGKFSGPDA